MILKLYVLKVGEWLDCSISNDLYKDVLYLSQIRVVVQLLFKMRDRFIEDMKSIKDRIVKEIFLIFFLLKVEEFLSVVILEDIVVDVVVQCLFKYVEYQLQYGGKFGNCLFNSMVSSL